MKRYSCSSCRILVYCYAMTRVGIRIWNFVNTGNEPQYSTLRAENNKQPTRCCIEQVIVAIDKAVETFLYNQHEQNSFNKM
jgi:hypothetical protein